MNVRVTKFDRFIETSQVCVGFYVGHPSVGKGLYVDSLVNMQGTDADMVDVAWSTLLPRVTEWVKAEQSKLTSTVGSTFTVPIVMVTVPPPTDTVPPTDPPAS
jgi:hypothetical protein